MNIGKTAALVTATAGAVAFGGGVDATALAPGAPGVPGSGVQQRDACDSAANSPVAAVGAGTGCLDFARVFGDPKSVVQKNQCDVSGAGSAANVVIMPMTGDSSKCANIAVDTRSTQDSSPFGVR
ncbi:hypothetical protein JK364_08250 [Streptomyces sp. 110]|uniref:Secreted protein n=1 Tax=Streptomyces endocoffeicus TaxID=2898945 RepID=A0ABS1PJ06_9ACTN|nr:hypothetical protein [Streptomyces endocoffeicus]MBL1112398.1 hypothetical protein [Streptomyces endocoffeicus]